MGKKVGQSTLKNRETPWNSKGFCVCRDYSSSINEMWLSIYLVVSFAVLLLHIYVLFVFYSFTGLLSSICRQMEHLSHSINSKYYYFFYCYFSLSSFFSSGFRVFIEFHSISHICWNVLLQLIESKTLLSSYPMHFLLAA